MKEEIYPRVTDEGAMGARLDCFSKPRGCPGMGGWKKSNDGWWARVKGEDAGRILKVSKVANDNTITMELDGDRIVAISK